MDGLMVVTMGSRDSFSSYGKYCRTKVLKLHRCTFGSRRILAIKWDAGYTCISPNLRLIRSGVWKKLGNKVLSSPIRLKRPP
jgi:hypothetical protein